ncbi:MAG: DUF2237 family protein [Rhodobacterales bacterium]|jgi:uncharacterized protein (DUF2237 family)|nr:DUF2237 domain-containing protein [Rhodobacter sp.]MCA3450606.1 DUF2237 domain-containing protein [Rhodobacter sp.]
MDPSLNVLGAPLEPCSTAPLTGFFRNGCCDTGPQDRGMHTVCALMTAEFLALSKYLGNDLSTPRPEYGFAGLKPGDRWCLCASRFLQAHEEGAAPKVRLAATHLRTLDIVPLDILQASADG